MCLQSRYYNPEIMRFISEDTYFAKEIWGGIKYVAKELELLFMNMNRWGRFTFVHGAKALYI